MKFRAMYKCQLCGKIYPLGVPHEMSYEKATTLVCSAISNPERYADVFTESFADNDLRAKLPDRPEMFHVGHRCDDERCGVAIFAGFEKAY